MKAFNLNDLKGHEYIVNHKGWQTEILSTDFTKGTNKLIITMEVDPEGKEDICTLYYPNGESYYRKSIKLYIKEEEKWVNVYQISSDKAFILGKVFNSKEEGVDFGKNNEQYLTTIKLKDV